MPRFRVQVQQGPDEHVVRVKGELDAATAPDLQASLVRLADEGSDRIVVDLTDVTFVDSCGLGSLVAARRHALDAGTPLVLRSPHARVQMLLEVTGLAGKVFAVEGAG